MTCLRRALAAVLGLALLVPYLACVGAAAALVYVASALEWLNDRAVCPLRGPCLAAVLMAFSALAEPTVNTPVQAVAASAYADTESSVYVPLTNGLPGQVSFVVDVSFVPTMSNNVEVAFGEDRDRDGLLSFSETDVAFGWDCGLHFTERVQEGVRYEADPTQDPVIDRGFLQAATNLTLTYSCTFNGIGSPLSGFYIDAAYSSQAYRAISIGPDSVVSGGRDMWVETYSGVSGEAWPWRSSWNMVRVTRRGSLHPRDPDGAVSVSQKGGVIHLY